MLKRFTTNFTVLSRTDLDVDHFQIVLKHPEVLPEIAPGQFVQVQIPDSSHTFLRRPISICDVNYDVNSISLIIKKVGNGTNLLSEIPVNSIVNLIYPLGNGFSLDKAGKNPLLIGGGVGIAPLYYLGRKLIENASKPEFLFGARSSNNLILLDEFTKLSTVNITTEDGSKGTKGFVVNHDCLQKSAKNYSSLLVCGPTPMMKAVAKIAKENNVFCEVSLENKMACGIGVCLCCVTETNDGHKCVCSDGPVFNINDLKW